MKLCLSLLGLLSLTACARPLARADAKPVQGGAVVEQAPMIGVERTEPKPARLPLTAKVSFGETDAPPPRDLGLRVEKGADGWVLVAERRGDLLSLRQGDARATGLGKASVEVATTDEPMVVEATAAKTLETTRVVVRFANAAGEAAPTFVAHLAAAPIDAGGDARDAHVCRAHEDSFGGFAIVCRVATEANAASVTGADPHEGVFAAMERDHAATTLARLDLDLDDTPAVAKAIAYNSHGRGVLVRAEASRAPGEARPSLVVASADRAQPFVRPIRHFCRIPLNADPL